MLRSVAIVVCVAAAVAHADTSTPQPIVGFRVRGDSKVRQRTLGFLAHLEIGDKISDRSIPAIEAALVSSELFEKVKVHLEPVDGGVLVVATLEDKHSWFAAPTLYLLGERRAVGAGFIENNLAGFNQKLLLYAQYGTHESVYFGTYLDPSVSGTPFSWRFDVYGYRRVIDEYLNPSDGTDTSIVRTSTANYRGAGFLVGWRHTWWLVSDLRLRGGTMRFSDAHAPDDTPLPVPQHDGWDVSTQGRITLDARRYRFGVRWGPYLQIVGETSIPGLDDYDYSSLLFRAYYGWRLFREHQLELRTNIHVGRNLPIQNDMVLGGSVDLRGYTTDRFRGDTRALFRVEYSVPITKWRIFAFRALGFWDSGFIGFYRPRTDRRNYQYPYEVDGAHWFRNDVGAGFRLYVKNVVLPLLGVDFAYGVEARDYKIAFALGLVDF